MKKIKIKTQFLFAGLFLLSLALNGSVTAGGKEAAQKNPGKTFTFLITDASKFLDVGVEVDNCNELNCSGHVVYQIFKKDEKKPLQTFRFPKSILRLGADQKPDQTWVIFDDFNFDGRPDLALRNGMGGQYGNPSYDIFLFQKAGQLFAPNRPLTKLTTEFSGLFQIFPDKKEIETRNVSGNAWAQIVRYRIVNNLPKKNYEETIVAVSDVLDKVTIRKLVNGKWKKTSKIVNRSEYIKGKKQN